MTFTIAELKGSKWRHTLANGSSNCLHLQAFLLHNRIVTAMRLKMSHNAECFSGALKGTIQTLLRRILNEKWVSKLWRNTIRIFRVPSSWPFPLRQRSGLLEWCTGGGGAEARGNISSTQPLVGFLRAYTQCPLVEAPPYSHIVLSFLSLSARLSICLWSFTLFLSIARSLSPFRTPSYSISLRQLGMNSLDDRPK